MLKSDRFQGTAAVDDLELLYETQHTVTLQFRSM